MTYNFDQLIDRSHTDCVKYELMRRETGRDDLLPLWVADMDFLTPDFITRAIERKLKQGVLGYTCAPDSYYETISSWVERRFGLSSEPSQIHYLPGIVPGIVFALQAFTEKGDGVLIETPVYHPFRLTVENTGRRLVTSSLLLQNGRYEMDFDDLEKKLPSCRMMILCNPHNPGGFTWKKETLCRLAELCHKYKVMVVSDEIHADLTLPGYRHIPFASVSDTAAEISLTLMAPSKAFNMPGVIAAYCIVKNDSIRRRYFNYLEGNDLAFGNVFAFDATQACYSEEGEQWLNAMLAYVVENIRFTEDYLKAHCSPVTMLRPEASFLIYLDNRELHLSQPDLVQFYQQRARLYLNDGAMFGPEGTGFMRLNVATPRATLTEALERLARAMCQ